jgi:sporulation protein YlmC with PRC-barrel domain
MSVEPPAPAGEEPPAGPTDQQAAVPEATEAPAVLPEGRVVGTAAANMIGRRVVTRDGREIGDIRDMLLVPGTGEVDQTIIVLDEGGKLVAIPWGDVAAGAEGGPVTVPMGTADLEAAPAFEYGSTDTEALVGPVRQ